VLDDSILEEQQSKSKPVIASQTVPSSSEANRRQLSPIRQVRFDCSAFDLAAARHSSTLGPSRGLHYHASTQISLAIVLQRDN